LLGLPKSGTEAIVQIGQTWFFEPYGELPVQAPAL
jgi:hypothetical protein